MTVAPPQALDRILETLAIDGARCEPMLSLVLSTIGDGVAITNVTGDTLYFNAAAKQILGIAVGEEPSNVRAHGSDLYYLDDFNPIEENDLPLVRALRGEEVKDVQLFARNASLPEGALICLNARPIREPAGKVVGGIAVFHDVGARKRAEEELRVANEKLGAWVAELERRAHVIVLMNEMADLLQSCRTLQEFYMVVSRFSSRIFAGESGAMFIVNSSRSAIEMVVNWGTTLPTERVFPPDGCWGLRRGRLHRAGGTALGPDCDHTSSDGTSGYTCIPMMGQGEALGVLHVHGLATESIESPDLGAAMSDSRLRTIIAVAEHIALALANLKLRETLRTQAIRDPLTSLFNRRYMEESLEREIARANRAGSAVAALMIDIDHFKRFNDTFGHAAADAALRETSAAIRAAIRTDDIACRFGGEELVVILPDTPLDQAGVIAESIRVAIANLQVRYQGVALGAITASFGVATSREYANGSEALLRAADAALYQAKSQGRNKVCLAEIDGSQPVPSARQGTTRPTMVARKTG